MMTDRVSDTLYTYDLVLGLRKGRRHSSGVFPSVSASMTISSNTFRVSVMGYSPSHSRVSTEALASRVAGAAPTHYYLTVYFLPVYSGRLNSDRTVTASPGAAARMGAANSTLSLASNARRSHRRCSSLSVLEVDGPPVRFGPRPALGRAPCVVGVELVVVEDAHRPLTDPSRGAQSRSRLRTSYVHLHRIY